jgi:hypothetical protein
MRRLTICFIPNLSGKARLYLGDYIDFTLSRACFSFSRGAALQTLSKRETCLHLCYALALGCRSAVALDVHHLEAVVE